MGDVAVGEACERAITDIRLIHRDYERARTTSQQRTFGRFHAERSATSDRATQLAVAVMSASVEQYAHTVLEDAGIEPRRIRDWSGKEAAWNAEFESDLRVDCANFPAMLGFYEARTAVMHSQGHLTDSQRSGTRRTKVDAALSAAGIVRHQRQLILTPEVAARCAEVGIAALREMESTRHKK